MTVVWEPRLDKGERSRHEGRVHTPHHFAERDESQLLALMEQHSFAMLVTSGSEGPMASHLPFLIERSAPERGTSGGLRLFSHMARANPQWRAFANEHECLVVFQGPHAYVSPGSYTSAPNVPTWNYAAVHAYGSPRCIEEPGEVLRMLHALSARHEAGRDQPWLPTQAREYVQRLLPGIVAFELQITRLEGQFKLSQNRSAEDRRGVIASLQCSASPGDREVAELMRAREIGI